MTKTVYSCLVPINSQNYKVRNLIFENAKEINNIQQRIA